MREDNYYSGKTYIWTYDKGGNILTKSEYAYTTGTLGEPLNTVNYSYGNSDWKDLLTEYNGIAISYDLSGNPLNWRNANALTWNGRRLAGMTLTDGSELAFEYNADGLRTSKTVGNSTVQYVWNEGNLIAEIRDGYTLKFLYNNGEAAGFSYNGADYYYGKDSFGVIRYLYTTSGEVVTTYTYDAWGTVLSVTGTLAETVGTVNPVRYKSYYLDSETGWYYLQSRYYDPVVGRFLNADKEVNIDAGIFAIGLFAYCSNNSITRSDPSGEVLTFDMVFSIGLLATITYKIYAKVLADKNYRYNKKQKEPRGMIHNQANINMKYGKTTISKSGCGVVAVYNALRYLFRCPILSKITYELDVRSYLCGFLGASIYAMNDLLKSNRLSTNLKLFPKKVDSLVKSSVYKMAIIAYAYSGGCHYTFVSWNGSAFELYNNDNHRSAQIESSLDSYMKKEGTYLAIICF